MHPRRAAREAGCCEPIPRGWGLGGTAQMATEGRAIQGEHGRQRWRRPAGRPVNRDVGRPVGCRRVAELTGWLHARSPRLIVLEATGGWRRRWRPRWSRRTADGGDQSPPGAGFRQSLGMSGQDRRLGCPGAGPLWPRDPADAPPMEGRGDPAPAALLQGGASWLRC